MGWLRENEKNYVSPNILFVVIFSSSEEIGCAIELFDEHENSESVGESPIGKAENIIDVGFH